MLRRYGNGGGIMGKKAIRGKNTHIPGSDLPNGKKTPPITVFNFHEPPPPIGSFIAINTEGNWQQAKIGKWIKGEVVEHVFDGDLDKIRSSFGPHGFKFANYWVFRTGPYTVITEEEFNNFPKGRKHMYRVDK